MNKVINNNFNLITLIGMMGSGKTSCGSILAKKLGISFVDIDTIIELEEKLKISRDKIYEKFFSKEFFCYMTGFIAGMPFLGDLETELRAKRLETPRVKVPKGSVGLTEQFANIYTFESPGGWNIIGNTPRVIFDSSKENNPNLINPGDVVTFEQITKDQYNNYNE